MTSLVAVAYHLPSKAVTVTGYLRDHGVREERARLYAHYFGFGEVRLEPGVGLAAQLVAAASGLPGTAGRVRHVVHARTMQVVALYPENPLREVCAALGLADVPAFTVSQHACASALLAVDLVGRLLEDEPEDALALVLAGEKVSTSRYLTDTGVMGEGTAAVLVGRAGERDRVLGYATRTHGEFHEGARMPDEQSTYYKSVYPGALVEVMSAAVRSAGLTLDDIALILPHNVNKMSWLRVLRDLGIRGADWLFLDNLPLIGHCFGADSFINYRTAVERGRLRRGDHYMMTSVGMGSTFSAMVLRH